MGSKTLQEVLDIREDYLNITCKLLWSNVGGDELINLLQSLLSDLENENVKILTDEAFSAY